MSRTTAEKIISDACGGVLPHEGDLIIRRRNGWSFVRLSQEGNTPAYTAANSTEDRSFDADATTVDELADVLATLIADLKVKGILP